MGIAYCPGYVHNSFKMETPPQQQRRADGHLGRFDPTVNPQMYLTRPWYAFVMRRLPEGKTLHEFPEHNSVAATWISNPPPAVSTGKIHPSHLFELFNRNGDLDKRILKLQPLARRKSIWWSMRPTDPSPEMIKGLKDHYLEFEDAIDRYAHIVRGIKLKAAWLDFVERKNYDVPWSRKAMREKPMETAEDNLMGAWINSANEEQVYWLIRQKVPVFIIHKITEMELFLCEEVRRLPGFVAGSEAEALLPAYNYLDHKADSYGKLRPPLLTDDHILTPDHLRWDMLDPEQFRYSLSRTFNMPGLVGQPTFGDMDESLVTESSKVNPFDSPGDEVTLPVNPAHLPRPLNLEVVDPSHIPWIRPPDIVHHRGGTWERFTESIDDSRMDCMSKVSKSDELGKYVWYDRERRRYLGFDFKPIPPPGLTTNVDVFGMPAPNIRFEQRIHNKTETMPRSRWMYTTRSPLKQHFTVKIVRPTKDKLPLCPTGDAPPKSVPLFSSADSEDEDEGGESEFVSDHEDDLLPTILQRKAMAEAKSAQEELAPVHPPPLPAPTTAETVPTTSRTIGPGSPPPNEDAPIARRTSRESLSRGSVVEGKEQIDVNGASDALLLSPASDAAVARLNNPDRTECSPIAEENPSLNPAFVHKSQITSNDMEVDPEDDILDYGMSDDETQPTEPTTETLIATEVAPQPLSLEEGGTSNLNEDAPRMSNQPNPVSDLVSRREAGSLGVIDLVATRRPTEFLVVTGAPIKEVSWADYLATMAHLIEDGSLYEGQFVQVVRTLQQGEQLFWMRSPSDRAAIAGRGYLSARYTIDGVTLNCSFVSHAEYVDAWRRRTNVWPEEDASELDPPPPDSPTTTSSSGVRPPSPPSIAYRFGAPAFLSDMAAKKGTDEEEPRVPLEQRLSSGPPPSLLDRMQVTETPSLSDRLGGIEPSTSKNANYEGHGGDDNDEDMEELPGNKR
ncbi:hypothetical protein DXG01_002081, partial [Tephrocybe rancida]